MNKFIQLSVLALLLAGSAGAQTSKNSDKISKDETIIIRKKGDSKEKLNIVVDGDKVTINGKPADEYKGDDVDVITNERWPSVLFAPKAPFPPSGGVQMFRDNFFNMDANKAFLGIVTGKGDGGAKVTEVSKESAAEKAGLKEGDIITKISDEKVEDAEDVYKAIGKYNPDDKVSITYKRDGKEHTTTATLGKNDVKTFTWNGDSDNFNFKMNPRQFRSQPFVFEMNRKPRLGIQAQDTENSKGVKVLDVDDDTPAAKAGLKEEDIITAVNGKTVNSVDEVRSAIKDVKDGETLSITYLRDGKSQTAEVKFPKQLKTSDL
ncbi:MAG: PDZ domain-containing protein [Ilyomonas sp.]